MSVTTPGATPLFWETLEARAASQFSYSETVYAATARLSLSFPGSLCEQETSPTEAMAWYEGAVNWDLKSIHYFCGGCIQCLGESLTQEEYSPWEEAPRPPLSFQHAAGCPERLWVDAGDCYCQDAP